MTEPAPVPQHEPSFTLSLTGLAVGVIVYGLLGWAIGGGVALALRRDWSAGARPGRWSGIALLLALVVRKIWVEIHSMPKADRDPSISQDT